MAVGKNKALNKGGKKGNKKKIIDPFTRKEWYDVKAPNMFLNRNVGKTIVNRTQGQKIASENLKGRIFEAALADLMNDTESDRHYRKIRLIAEDVQDHTVLCNFHGMDMSTDKYRMMVRKWQTLVEANVDARTTDGYLLRVFCIGFTAKDTKSRRKTCYAQHSQVRKIRARMCQLILNEVTNSDLKTLVPKLAVDSLAKEIEKACHRIYPLHNVYIRKVKVIKKPRFDLSKLLELHGDGGGRNTGEAVVSPEGVVISRPEGYEPPVQTSV